MNEHLAALFPEAEPDPQPEPITVEAAPIRLPVNLAPEIEAERAAKNAARHDWIAELGRQERAIAHGYYQRQADIWVNTTDPDVTMMHKKGGGSAMGYHTHYAVDGGYPAGEARIILSVLVTPSEVMDNQPMQDLLWHSRFRWQLPLQQVTGDTRHGTAENIVAIEHAGLHAYLPLPDFEHRTSFYGKQRFSFDAAQDQYRCPQGAILRRWKTKYTERVIVYRADAETCNAWPPQSQVY